jgi:hypothetical protein
MPGTCFGQIRENTADPGAWSLRTSPLAARERFQATVDFPRFPNLFSQFRTRTSTMSTSSRPQWATLNGRQLRRHWFAIEVR